MNEVSQTSYSTINIIGEVLNVSTIFYDLYLSRVSAMSSSFDDAEVEKCEKCQLNLTKKTKLDWNHWYEGIYGHLKCSV